jgi:hypothetical protein
MRLAYNIMEELLMQCMLSHRNYGKIVDWKHLLSRWLINWECL